MHGPNREQAAFSISCQSTFSGQIHNAAADKSNTMAMIPIK